MLNLTPAAAEQILRAASAQQTAPASSPSLRIAAKVEAGELVYGMGFDDGRENDAVIEAAGVTLLIAPLSQEFLVGATLDFVELRPGEFQFIFTNPNTPAPATSACASRSSGCGSCGSGSAGGCN